MTEQEIRDWRHKELERLDSLVNSLDRTSCLTVITVLSGVLGDTKEDIFYEKQEY